MKAHATHHMHLHDRRGSGGRRGPRGRRYGRGDRARSWMWENPSTSEVIAMLEEYQRDLEQEVENVASRIRDLEADTGDDN